MSTPKLLPWEHRGAVHSELTGSETPLRFRPRRLSTEELTFDLSCLFQVDNQTYGPARILNISPTGFAIDPGRSGSFAPGSAIRNLRIFHREKVVWEGEAQAIYQVDGPSARLGFRFTSGLFDLQSLQLNDSFVGNRLGSVLKQSKKYSEALPESWRARVATVRRLLEDVRDLLAETEDRLSGNLEVRIREERELFKETFDSWGPHYHEELGQLHETSKGFDAETAALGHAYARRELLPLVYPCPMHSRCYEKPLGYAGDYRMMLLMLTDAYEGDSLYARFLHHVSKNYSFGRAVPAREATLRDKIASFLGQGRPKRIVSLACGPAVELRRLLQSTPELKGALELILVDQDEQTLQYCHESLSGELLSHPSANSAPVALNCLHISVKQILKPKDDSERHFITVNLKHADLIYTVGLFDYLPQSIARLLVRKLYSFLRPTGELFIGNLRESPDTSWMMEHTLDWHLEYRTQETMTDLARGLQPRPSSVEVVSDATGNCLFLGVVRPEDS